MASMNPIRIKNDKAKTCNVGCLLMNELIFEAKYIIINMATTMAIIITGTLSVSPIWWSGATGGISFSDRFNWNCPLIQVQPDLLIRSRSRWSTLDHGCLSRSGDGHWTLLSRFEWLNEPARLHLTSSTTISSLARISCQGSNPTVRNP